jgi:biopolymer transport protein ExbD
MAIARPGLRPREGKRQISKPRRRPSAVSLSMTSMIDVLVVLTVFLLITFETPDMCQASSRKLPIATNGFDVVEAPLITVEASGTYLDGAKVATKEDLVTKLKARRALWRQLHPGRENQPENILLAIDADVPSGTVKQTVKAAADGGYPSIDFMVMRD